MNSGISIFRPSRAKAMGTVFRAEVSGMIATMSSGTGRSRSSRYSSAVYRQ